jgi:hypothetical protein
MGAESEKMEQRAYDTQAWVSVVKEVEVLRGPLGQRVIGSVTFRINHCFWGGGL